MQIPFAVETWNATKLEQYISQQYHHMLSGARVMVTTEHGGILDPNEQYDPKKMGMLVVFPMPVYGGDIDIPKLIKAVAPLVQPQLRHQQVRLLLRGEEGLAARIYKAQFDGVRTKQILLETALKYGMQPKGDSPLGSVKQSTPQKDQEQAGSGWKTVTSARQRRETAAAPVKPKAEQIVRYALDPTAWSHKVLPHFKLATEGVYLEEDQTSAARHAKQLQGAKDAIALVTVRPIEHEQSTRVTFKIHEESVSGHTKSKLVSGYLTNMGQGKVRHLGEIADLTRPRLRSNKLR